jgi:lipopolysaccharide export LptBFGC system permease protein LptF
LKVALDIHEILMLKNKIHKYLSIEILKNFITILLTFTSIAWVVRAVNFLDLMVDSGYSSIVYFQYSLLNITTIMTNFVPLSFLLSLTISIVKFEKQQEFLILWTSGLSKIKIANVFIFVAFFITLFQLILSIFVNPLLLNKSRNLIAKTESTQVNSVLKANDFVDSFRGVTFYINEKNNNNELLNIFIRDTEGSLNTLEGGGLKSTIIAKKGYATNNKLILFDGIIQKINKENKMKNILFEKTELSLDGISTRIIVVPKIQETSSKKLLKCFFSENNILDQTNCSSKEYKREVLQNLSKRVAKPLYVLLISVIISFLLIYKKEKKYNFLKKYTLFIFSFLILVAAEIFLKYTGRSILLASAYHILPIIISALFYTHLIKKINTEKVS